MKLEDQKNDVPKSWKKHIKKMNDQLLRATTDLLRDTQTTLDDLGSR